MRQCWAWSTIDISGETLAVEEVHHTSRVTRAVRVTVVLRVVCDDVHPP